MTRAILYLVAFLTMGSAAWCQPQNGAIVGSPPCSIATATQYGCTLSTPASSQSQPSNPTAPASTSTYAMQGLAGTITPKVSGIVSISICALVTNSSGTAGDGILFQVSYGTGTAPSNAGTLAGTQTGQPAEYRNGAALTAADVDVTVCAIALATMTPNVTYWIDLAAKSVGTVSVTALTNINVMAVEN